tara:strand:+ start:77 stop:241 length:165 start_codon:yes stop_codon:yes gene_type:complete
MTWTSACAKQLQNINNTGKIGREGRRQGNETKANRILDSMGKFKQRIPDRNHTR